MPFKQNYLKELPDDILDKIYLFVNKHKFDNCLIDINNPKIKLFHEFNSMITDSNFFLGYSLYESKKLGWFWDFHKHPFHDEDSFVNDMDLSEEQYGVIFDLFERDKRLSYKDYTKISLDYQNIRFYKLKYINNFNFNKNELLLINTITKNNFVNAPIKNSPIILKKLIFTKNYIHIYIHKHNYHDNSPVDIAFNLFWIYEAILDTLDLLNDACSISFDTIINHFETYNYLQHFQIKNKIVETTFANHL